MKYKVGDKVKVRANMHTIELEGEYDFVDEMIEYKFVTIASVFDGHYKVEENKYVYTDEMLCDVVNHLEHYNKSQFECIDEMVILFGKQAVIDWCKLTSYKYKYRANYKENLDEDLKKADWYLAKAKELEEVTE